MNNSDLQVFGAINAGITTTTLEPGMVDRNGVCMHGIQTCEECAPRCRDCNKPALLNRLNQCFDCGLKARIANADDEGQLMRETEDFGGFDTTERPF